MATTLPLVACALAAVLITLLPPPGCAAQMIAATPGEMVSAFVQVAHRHGARTPITPSNETVICGPQGCGVLNHAGRAMLVEAGKWLRSKYVKLLGFTDKYDPLYAYTRSTALSRTLQSADGLLHGLYPDNASYFPVIDTVHFNTDVLLLVDALPAFHIPQQLGHAQMIVNLDGFVLSLLNRTTLAAMGVELSLVAMCSNTSAGLAAQCALTCQDIAASLEADGTLPSLPLTSASFGALNKIRVKYNTALFPYDAADSVNAQRGSLGQNLAQRLISNMKQSQQGVLGQYFMEYSAHDTTVMPLCATLGHNHMMLPLFGQMYVFEMAYNALNTSIACVRAFYGAPQQTPGTYDYDGGMQVLPLNCIAPNGTAYQTKGEHEYCPIDDLWRYINTSLPKSPQGLCYLSDDAKKQLACSDGAAAVGSLCWFYRTMCPQYACPAGRYVDFTDISCSSAHQGVDAERRSVAIVASVTALGGILVGVVLGLAIPKLLARRSPDYSQLQ